jgi:hypothetical protein
METFQVINGNLKEALAQVYFCQLCILEYLEMGLFEECPLFHLGKFIACDVFCARDEGL